jgi:CDP-paratose 2-epimerase
MKWVITGGAGFIGCHAAAHFLAAGHQVVAIDNLSRHGSTDNLAWLRAQGLSEFVRADVRDFEAMRSLFHEHADADAVLHLAGQVAVTSSVTDPRTDFDINALGTFNVLEAVRTAAAARPAVLYSSTNKVYGNLDHVQVANRNGRYHYVDRPDGIDEREPIDLHSPYGCSKGAGDQYVRDYARIYGMRTITFRQSCIYGTRQFGIEDQGWIAWLCAAAILGKPFTIFGDGMQVRDTLWVGDLVVAYTRAYERIDAVTGEVFNLGGGPGNTLSLLELVARLEFLVGPVDVRFAPWRPGDQRVFVADVRKAKALLNWAPTITTPEGVDHLVSWVRDNRDAVAAALAAKAEAGEGREPSPTVPLAALSSRIWRSDPAHPALRRPSPRIRPKRRGRLSKPSTARTQYRVQGGSVVVQLSSDGANRGTGEPRAIIKALEQALDQARGEDGAQHAA